MVFCLKEETHGLIYFVVVLYSKDEAPCLTSNSIRVLLNLTPCLKITFLVLVLNKL